MKLWSDSFENGAAIPEAYALGKHNPDSHVEFAGNKSPHLAWSGVPDEARSLVLLCCDVDVPSRGDDVNQEGKTVPADLPRVDFFHWVLLDLPAENGSLAEGEFSEGVTPRGKDGPPGPRGLRQGLNDYTGWFSGDADMEGKYYGYDGPCPPWNDEIVHHYHFVLYALDVERLELEGDTYGGQAVRDAMEGHVLAEARIVGSYHIHPEAVVKS